MSAYIFEKKNTKTYTKEVRKPTIHMARCCLISKNR